MSTNTIHNRRLQLLGVVVFGSLSLVAVSVFLAGLISLSDTLVTSASVVTFNSGVFKLLGVALGLGALAVYTGIQWGFKRIPSGRVTKLATGTMVGGLILLFLLPHAVHIPLERHLFNRGYKLCEPKSRSSFSYKTVVYTIDVPVCLEGLGQVPSKR